MFNSSCFEPLRYVTHNQVCLVALWLCHRDGGEALGGMGGVTEDYDSH